MGECLDAMIVTSSDKEWLQWPIETLMLETVLSEDQPQVEFDFQVRRD